MWPKAADSSVQMIVKTIVKITGLLLFERKKA